MLSAERCDRFRIQQRSLLNPFCSHLGGKRVPFVWKGGLVRLPEAVAARLPGTGTRVPTSRSLWVSPTPPNTPAHHFHTFSTLDDTAAWRGGGGAAGVCCGGRGAHRCPGRRRGAALHGCGPGCPPRSVAGAPCPAEGGTKLVWKLHGWWVGRGGLISRQTLHPNNPFVFLQRPISRSTFPFVNGIFSCMRHRRVDSPPGFRVQPGGGVQL